MTLGFTIGHNRSARWQGDQRTEHLAAVKSGPIMRTMHASCWGWLLFALAVVTCSGCGAGTTSNSSSQPVEVDPQVAKAMQELGAKGYHLYADFKQDEQGRITAQLICGEPEDRAGVAPETLQLEHGRGIPLAPGGVAIAATPVEGPRKNLSSAASKQGEWTIHPVKLSDEQGYDIEIKKLLWSEDGDELFVLTTRGGLLKIDAKFWKLLYAHLPQVTNQFILDIAWTSQGLAVVQNNTGYADSSRQAPYVLISVGARGRAKPTHVSVGILNPATLRVTKAWLLIGDTIAGSPESPYLYVADRFGHLMVVDTARGELVNLVYGPEVPVPEGLRSDGQSLTPPNGRKGIEMRQLEASPDGRYLLAMDSVGGDMTQIVRFRAAGPALFCEQLIVQASDEGSQIQVCADSRHLCISENQRGAGCVLRSLTDFSEIVASLPKDDDVRYCVADTVHKTVFLHQRELTEPGLGKIVAVHGGGRFPLPLHESASEFADPELQHLHVRPGHYGVFVSTIFSNYWVEGRPTVAQWPFKMRTSAGTEETSIPSTRDPQTE